MKRKPVPPTQHLRTAIRKIDQVAFRLYDEQLATYIAYVLAVSRGEKREIRRLFRAKLTAFGDLSVALEAKLSPKERHRAVRLCAYEAEIASLCETAKRLQSRMEDSYQQQRRFERGIAHPSGERQPKPGTIARSRPALLERTHPPARNGSDPAVRGNHREPRERASAP